MKKENLLKVFLFHCFLAFIICPFYVNAKTSVKNFNILDNVSGCDSVQFPYCLKTISSSSANILRPWTHYFNFNESYDLSAGTTFEISGFFYYWSTDNPGAVQNSYNVSVTAVYANGNAFGCEVSGTGMFNIICPVDPYQPFIRLIFQGFGPVSARIGLNYVLSLYKDSEASDIINNQNKNQQQTNDRLDSMKEQQHQDSQNEVNATNKNTEAINGMNNTIKDSNTTEASNSANQFFSGFESDDFGLTAIITAPLNFIKSITSSTCTPLGFNAPFVNQRVTLPCMGAIYKEHFGGFLTLYQTITFGIVAYWVCVNTLATVRGFKDPESDRIEVLDL